MPKRWPTVALGEVCQVNPRLSGQPIAPDTEISFVPMSAVDEMRGVIAEKQVRAFREVSKGYTSFRDNDVLFAKITPCMQNGKAAVATGLCNGIGFGSTEFHVLRSKGAVLPRWVFYFVRRPHFRAAAEASFTGTAGQQRVPASFLEQTEITLPPLTDQQRLVAMLDEADALRQRRAQADRRTAELLPALFHRMFGNPAKNPKRWPKVKLGTLCELVNGAAFKPSDWDGGGTPIVRIQNLNDPTKPFNYTSKKMAEKFRVRAGDILLSWSGTPGTSFGCFRWNGVEGWLNQHIFNVKLHKEIDGEFFIHSVNARLNELISRAHGAVGLQHVTKGTLNDIEILLPPMPLQREFAARVGEVRALETAQARSRGRLDALFASLLDRAFKGEL